MPESITPLYHFCTRIPVVRALFCESCYTVCAPFHACNSFARLNYSCLQLSFQKTCQRLHIAALNVMIPDIADDAVFLFL